MQMVKIAVLVAFLFAATANAGEEQLAAMLPSCAVGSMADFLTLVGVDPTDNVKLECMMSSMSQTSCAATDQKCLCMDAKYTAVLEECVLASCTIRQSLSKIAHPLAHFQSSILKHPSYEERDDIGLWSPNPRPDKGRFLFRSGRWYCCSDCLHSQDGGSFQMLRNNWYR